MSSFIPPTKFLGVEITRVEYETGMPSLTGNVLILRQVGKINEMAVEFAQDIEALFPAAKGTILKTPLPGNHNRPVEELTPMMQTLCTPALITRMMEMNGCVLWVASSTRHDLRFAVHWCSTKIVAPIFRDYYMCVHMVLYLIQTKMYPLLLGGPGPIDAYGYSDGSLHTGSKMRSVGSYFVFATPLGGAIQSNTFETKYQVLNVMHVELDAITQLANALLYVTHACLELNAQAPTTRRIFSPITRRIYTDSEAAQAHCLNNSASKKSKHLELRLQTVQDYQEDDRIDVIHVPGADNCADQGSKSLDPDTNLKHMVVILGHRMMPGKGIEGVQEYVPDIAEKVTFTRTVQSGPDDVTTDQKACEEFEKRVVFSAQLNYDDLMSLVAESISLGLKSEEGESTRDSLSEDGGNERESQSMGVYSLITGDGSGPAGDMSIDKEELQASEVYSTVSANESESAVQWISDQGKNRWNSVLQAYKWAVGDVNQLSEYTEKMIEDENVNRLFIGMDVGIAIDLAEHRIGWKRIIGNSLKEQFALLNYGVAISMLDEQLVAIMPKLVAAHRAGCTRMEFNRIMVLPTTPMWKDRSVELTAVQEVSFALKHEVTSKFFFLTKAQSDKRESIGEIDRLTSSLTAAISAMEIATEGGEEYVRSQQRIISFIRQITSENEWSKELDAIVASNTESSQDSIAQMKRDQDNVCLMHIHNVERLTLETDSVSSIHSIPSNFGKLYWFRRWLHYYASRLIWNESSPVVGLHEQRGRSGNLGRRVDLITHQLLDIDRCKGHGTGYKGSKFAPRPNHIAAFHAVLRNIDTYYQTGSVCGVCGHVSPLSAR